MPSDGYSAGQYIEDNVTGVLAELMKTDDVMDMVVVLLEFEKDDDIFDVAAKAVEAVDAEYRTIASPDYRAVLGVDQGAYLAFLLSYFEKDGGTVSQKTEPDLFKAVGSHNGDFTSKENIWREKCGIDMTSLNADDLGGFYTYIDACSTNPLAYAKGGTNDVAAVVKGGSASGSYDVFEYSIRMPERYGTYTDAMARSLNRFSNVFGRHLVSGGSFELDAHGVPSGMDSISLKVDVTVDQDAFDAFFNNGARAEAADQAAGEASLTVAWTMINANGESENGTNTETISSGGKPVTMKFTLPAAKVKGSTSLTVTVSTLGWTCALGTDGLVQINDPVLPAEENGYAVLDLMGDWHFNPYVAYNAEGATGEDTLPTYDDVKEVDWKQWQVVQPGLGWWSTDFVNNSMPGGVWGYWAGFAWYIREFEVPEGFPLTGLMYDGGMIDEGDETYINGVRIGNYGIPEQGGSYDGSNPWDQERLYKIPDGVLQTGKNVIAVRMFNAYIGGGGWYTGPISIYSASAYNQIIGRPSTAVDETVKEAVIAVVQAQNAALADGDKAAYLATVSTDYFEAGVTRSSILNSVVTGQAISDGNVSVFSGVSENGVTMYMYQASRTVGDTTGDVYLYFVKDGDTYKLYGDHARWYSVQMAGTTGEDNMYYVYLPQDYFTSGDTRYPVTYMQHGINSTGLALQIAGVPEILDAATAADPQKNPATITVYPNLGAMPLSLNPVSETIVKEVDSSLRTIPDRRYRGMAGESWGGLTVGETFVRPDLYSWEFDIYGAGAVANENWGYTGGYPTDAALQYLQNFRTYMIAGNHDSYNFDLSHIGPSSALYRKGYDHVFEIDNGEHNSSFFGSYVADAYAYIMQGIKDVEQPRDDAISGEVSWTGNASDRSITVNWNAKLTGYEQLRPTYVALADKNNENATPATGDLIVPVTVTVKQGDSVLYETTELVTVSSGEISGSAAIPGEYLAAAGDDCTVVATVSVLEKNIPLGTAKEGSIEDDEKCDGGASCPSKKFTDVDQTQWYHEGVDYVISKKMMNGTGAATFSPDTAATRAMVVTALYRLEGKPAVTRNIPFSDVEPGLWYSGAITWATTNGIIGEYGDAGFAPNNPATLAETIEYLRNYAAYKGYGMVDWTAVLPIQADNLSRGSVAMILMQFCTDAAK